MRRLPVLLLLAALPCVAATEEELWADAKQVTAAFEKRTGVPMVWLDGDPAKGQTVGDGIVAFPPTALDAAQSTPALVNELSIYPEAFLKRSGLRKIVVARGLEREGRAWGGFAFWGGTKKGTLFVGLRNLAHAAKVIHHEIFHLTQHTSAVEAKASAWRGCNPEGFVYASEGEVDRTRARVATITPYARTNLDEDQAETFAWAVVDQPFLELQSKQDAAIDCKAKLVREFVKLVDSSFDDARWAKFAQRRPGEPLP
jgi:hypothetical protein